ncbi:site-2 protease family protein [Rhodoplanes roseus]|uniref:Zinc metalloprotease n=1 Tax=Rhodoplanes roseus TaxID=29409 RepID=A0A327KR77_9BRAD|nr:site-2 protease family protein [Rhodoplanes roseus]RAI40777.1 site-2 protease family protein [Rhodoplanes roseus]
MPWSVNIGSIAGTAVRIHVTFVLFLVWIFAASWAQGGAEAAWSGLVFMIAVFACVLAHEFGHIFAARAFGVTTPDVTLLPIGGVARLERIPEAPGEEFLVAVAGPAVNVVIAFLLIVVLGADPAARNLSAIENTTVSLADKLAAVNIFLVLFNMIPAFPMDGGRVLRALLAIRLGHVRATEIAAWIGQATAFAFGFIGLFSNPMLIFIAIFVYMAATSEAQLVAIRAMSRDVPVSAAMITQFATLTPDEPIEAAIETLLSTSQQEFPVVDGQRRLFGVLSRADMIRALKEVGPQAPVSGVMTTDIPVMSHRGRLETAFAILQEKQKPAVGIVDAGGGLIGLVTSETVGEMLMVRDALPKGTRMGPWGRAAGA